MHGLAWFLSIAIHVMAILILENGSGRQNIGQISANILRVELIPDKSSESIHVSEDSRKRSVQVPIPVPQVIESKGRISESQYADGKFSAVKIERERDPRYFHPKDLTEQPSVVRNIPPDFQLYLPQGLPEPAKVVLLINEHGSIDQVVVLNNVLPVQARNEIINVFSKIKFRPGRISGKPVKVQLQIEIGLGSGIIVGRPRIIH